VPLVNFVIKVLFMTPNYVTLIITNPCLEIAIYKLQHTVSYCIKTEKILLNKTVSSFIRQELQNSQKAMKIHFQNWIKYIQTKYQKEKNKKRENNHRKNHPHLGKKLKIKKTKIIPILKICLKICIISQSKYEN
jgi:ABC-type anion transport system duplicated permease subunit